MKRYILQLLLLLPLTLGAQTILTLPHCRALARKHNLTLQNALLEIESAEEQQSEAFTKYFPDLQANVMAFQAFDDMVKGDGTIPPEVAMINPDLAVMAGMPYSYSEFSRMYSASAVLTQPIFAGGQIRSGNKLSKIQTEVAQLKCAIDEKYILQKVTECYWQIATVKYNLNTIEAANKQLDAVLEQVNNYVKAGVTTRNSLLQVQLRQQELASNKLKLQNAQHVLLLLLAQQIGMSGQQIDIDTDIDASAITASEPQQNYIPVAEAVENRDELQMAQLGVRASEEQVKMERGKNLPTIAVGAMGYHTGMGGLSDNVKQNMNTRMTNGLVFGTVSVPITSWWGGSHAIKRQKIKLQQARNTAEEARQQLALDVESAWSNLTEAYQQIAIAEKSVDQAADNLRMCSEQYRMGTIALTDLLDAETLNRQAQNSLSEARATYQIRLADYQSKTR